MENAMTTNYGHKPILAPMKVFTCKYCGRKFLNSRALGGHQNAHKKERTIWMSNRKSIGLETHSLFRNPVLQQEDMNTQTGDSWRKQKFKEVADHDSCWSGCFHLYDSNSNVPDKDTVTASNTGKSVQDDSNLHDLDLDLHL